MADIQGLLDGVIETKIQDLGSLTSGSDEEKAAIQSLATLHKLRIEEIKAQTEADEHALKERELNCKDADRAHEEALQERQVKAQMIERYVRFGVDAANLVLPLVFYGIWMNRGFKFEETGAFTSTTFKNLLNRFRPTK